MSKTLYNLEEGLKSSIFYWMNYFCNVSKSDILLESSIRFPLTEYLERKFNADVTLEVPHPKFKNKFIDFKYVLKEAKDKSGYIELKFLKRGMGSKDVRQRIFDDIIRLAVLDENVTNYFIICGRRDFFNGRFRRIVRPFERERIPCSKRDGSKMKPFGVYSEWFPFEYSETKTIDLHSDLNKEYIEEFNNNYNEMRKIPIKLIETKLVAKTLENKKLQQIVHIWRVKKVS